VNYTPKQLQILRMIHQYQQRHSYSPTYAELAKELKVSTITVFEHLEALERKGAIRRRRHEARSVEIIEPRFSADNQRRAAIPVRGTIAAGAPIEATAAAPAEELSLESVFGQKHNTYVLRVKGNSMVEDHILDGDLIVVEGREKAKDGEIVVALDDSGKASLRRLRHENGKVRLQPFSSALPPVNADRVRIQGVFQGLVRKAR